MCLLEARHRINEFERSWREMGRTPRRVIYDCAGGRIPGAVKMATIWLIPKDAQKSIDGRPK